jgi:hypothetical protein
MGTRRIPRPGQQPPSGAVRSQSIDPRHPSLLGANCADDKPTSGSIGDHCPARGEIHLDVHGVFPFGFVGGVLRMRASAARSSGESWFSSGSSAMTRGEGGASGTDPCGLV